MTFAYLNPTQSMKSKDSLDFKYFHPNLGVNLDFLLDKNQSQSMTSPLSLMDKFEE